MILVILLSQNDYVSHLLSFQGANFHVSMNAKVQNYSREKNNNVISKASSDRKI